MKLFLDLLPGHPAADVAAAVSAGATPVLERGREWRVVRSIAEIQAAPAGCSLWLRGVEASGDVGEIGALTLIRAATATGRPWVCEGLGLQAMAAALAVGAAGVVVDVAAWCTEGSPLAPEVRNALLRCRSGRDTAVLNGRRVLRGPLPHPAPQCVTEAHRGEGRTAVALTRHLREALDDRLGRIATHHALSRHNPSPTPVPLVQGPMANIAEGVGVAAAVSARGGLPFAALGALRPDQAEAVLRDFAALDAPWGVGVIGFEMMPHRDAHLAAIEALGDRGPCAVTLAGASPGLALELKKRGLDPWLHTPSATLAGQALRRGIQTVIFEGRDAGGHVGQLSSVGLWEEGLIAVCDVQGPRRAVLAGGIGDSVTSAFAAAMGAEAIHSGASVLLQSGTAFLFTHEIVEAGQLTAAGQQAGLGATRTVLVGESVNLPLRCVPNAYTTAARQQEADWLAEGLPLDQRRAQMEAMNLGRTRIAAKGIERDPASGPGQYRAVTTSRQRLEGAFSVGEGAALTQDVRTVAQVMRAMTADASTHLDGHPASFEGVSGGPRQDRIQDNTEVRLGARRAARPTREPIAIVGLGCVLPGAPDVDQFWRNLLEGVDSVTTIPEDRWSSSRYYDPAGQHPGRSVSRAAGVVGAHDFDPMAFRIPPRQLAAIDPAQRLALRAADQAVRDAGWHHPSFDRTRAAVILGNSMGGEHAKSLALRVRYPEVLAALEAEGALDGLLPETRAALFAGVEARLSETLPPLEAESMAGLLANVIAGRVASWLDWMGGSFTVDAACASSLASVAVAVDWLQNGRCDAVLAGGVDADLSPETYAGFSRTQALSPHGSSPFSNHADGFSMGEGAAVLALCRLEDATRQNLPVYAVIHGVGQASDGRGRGITAPKAAGQSLAIERAWSQADLPLSRIELIEAHGTGTQLGDATEVAAWRDQLGATDARPWLGTVKSNIGHLKGGAGAAGLLKATLALATRTVPPTLHAGPVAPELTRDRSPLRLPRLPVALGEDALAGVSAFGFGGTNFHAVVGPAPGSGKRPARLESLVVHAAEVVQPSDLDAQWSDVGAPLLLAFGAATPEDLAAAIREDRPCSLEACAAAHCRLVALAEPGTRAATLERAGRWLAQNGDGQLGTRVFRGQGAALPVIALVPGQGAQSEAMQATLRALPAGARALAGVEDYKGGADPVTLHRAMVSTACGWAAVLRAAGVPLAGALGHSLGELGALVAACRWTADQAMDASAVRGRALAESGPGAMLAVPFDSDAAQQVATEFELSISALNSPDQSVLAGSIGAVEAAATALTERGHAVRRLTVERAYHTPAMAPAAAALAEHLVDVGFTPGFPVWSAARASLMQQPSEDLVAAIDGAVRFVDAVRAITQALPGPFVELGPGATLTRLVGQIAPDRVALALDPTPGDGGLGLASAAAQLLALGHPGLARALPATRLRIALPAANSAQARAPEPAPRPTPRPPEQRQATPGLIEPSIGPIREAVLRAVCEVTGYPADFIEGDAELEAEFGVDSIRKLEILGRLEDELGFRTLESDYGMLEKASVDDLSAFVERRLQATESPTSTPAAVGLWTWRPAALAAPSSMPAEGLQVDQPAWRIHPEPARRSAADVRSVLDELSRAAANSRPTSMEVWCQSDHPPSLAAAAFCRSVSREWSIPVRTHGSRLTAQGLVPLSLESPENADYERPHLLCTGGLAGILLPILTELADVGPVVTVIGRSALDGPGERSAAHRLAFEKLEAMGVQVRWIQADLSVEDALAGAVALALETAPVDVVLHAAGALADGPSDAIDADQLGRILGPKVDAAEALCALLPGVPFVLFGSIASSFGSPGQAAYSAANGALHGLGIPGCTVDLTAWAERGMASENTTQRLLERRGLTLLDPVQGARAMRAVVLATLVGEVPRHIALLAQDPREALALPWPLHAVRQSGPDALVLSMALSPQNPRLDDHQLQGRPVVPAAVWLQAFVDLASLATEASAWAIDDFAVHAPTFVREHRTDLQARLEHGGLVHGVAVTGGDTTIASAKVGPTRLPNAPVHPPLGGPRVSAPYGDTLFHGSCWQVLHDVRLAIEGASAEVRPATLRPVESLVDAAHQLLALWTREQTGWLGLPVGADRWTVAASLQSGPYTLRLSAEAHDDVAIADLWACGPDGEPVLFGEGVTLHRAMALEAADV